MDTLILISKVTDIGSAFFIPNLNAMQPSYGGLVHLF